MAVPPQFIDEVMARTDLVALVSEYVHLQQKGQDHWGLCPFHLEKKPSFHVLPERGFYKCFGCGKGGGAANFLMEIENLSFLEAIEKLADRVNMQMPVASWEDGQAKQVRDRILVINKRVAQFYCHMLNTPEGQYARGYLENRGLKWDTLLRFGIGFAPDRWDGVLMAMTSQGISVEDLLEAGLAKRNEKGRVYDRFRNRVMFPIINTAGNVIGFGGRIMDQGEPKYLNSPDTPVFDKSRNLYGLNIAKKSKYEAGILTEGYMDTIALHQGGFDSAVASLGTSFTEGHGQLLARYFKKSILAYDSDGAGVSAANRAIPILEKAGMSVKVLQMKDAKDPDEFIKKFGAGAFSNLLEKSEHHIYFRLMQLQKKYNMEDMAQKVDFLQDVANFLATVESPVERELYADKSAEILQVSLESVLFEVNKAVKVKEEQVKRQGYQNQMRGKPGGTQGAQRPDYKNIQLEKAEEGLLRVLSLDPSHLKDMVDYTSKDFTNEALGKYFQVIKERYFQGLSIELNYLAEYFTSAEMNYFVYVVSEPQDLSFLEQAKADYLRIIQEENEKLMLAGEDGLWLLQQLIDEERDA